MVDRDGKRPLTTVNLTEPASRTVRTVNAPGAPVTLRLPKARYDLSSPIFTGEEDNPTSLTLAARPDLVLDKDVRVALDARKGRPIRAVLDATTATSGLRRAVLDNGSLAQGVGTDIEGFDLYATPTPPVTAYPYAFTYQTAMAEPEAAAAQPLPRGYNLYLPTKGRIPDPTFRVRDGDLATLTTSLHSQAGSATRDARMLSYPWTPGSDLSWAQGYDVRLPSRRLDLYSGGGGLGWGDELMSDQGTELGYNDVFLPAYKPGSTQKRSWNAAPLGVVARPVFAYDRLWVALSSHAPAAYPHVFLTDGDGVAITTELWKNGDLVGSNEASDGGTFEVPAERATYEIRTEATRDVPWSTLGTRVTARWKVTAGPAANDRLPFPNLWISGAVDLQNRAPASTPFPVRMRLEAADGTVPAVRSVGLAASFDDGRTWRKVPVVADGAGFRAVVPASARGFVSLRASVRGTDGSQLDQTVIRAYRIKG